MTSVDSRARLLVVQPDPVSTLDLFAPILESANIDVQVVQPYAGESVAGFDYDALLVLGGSMSTLDDAGFPWLESIRRLIRDAEASGRPSLGICLGAQLTAQAFGGRVGVGRPGFEAGLTSIRWREPARGDLLAAALPAPFLTASFHGDAIEELPPEATWLGTADMYANQAFRVGQSTWGVQFHPEISLDTYRRWQVALSADEPRLSGLLSAGERQFEEHQPEAYDTSCRFAKAFAQVVNDSARAVTATPARSPIAGRTS
ncbi:MAG: type 1 glutamine amidotransferase [Nocardioidaceae bacterium]